jgi:hypothetical protein
MDIRSGGTYPSNKLSNFATHPFIYDGIQCFSMEGFLQSLKFKNPDMQIYVCTLSGKAAKMKGSKKNWKTKQLLWWKGEPIARKSNEYQDLIINAFEALSKNDGFCRALLSTQKSTLKHSMGHKDERQTVLTEREFCSILTNLRLKLQGEKNND